VNIFEIMYPKFTFKKNTITLFEAFAGIGSQAIALNQLSKEFGFKLDTIGISEIDKYAILAYNAIHGETKNYGSICDIQEIPQVDIFTYSFPCQDISLAGNRKGFSRDSNTRSGLLWEVERLLENQEKIDKLPQVLLMENVKALVGMKFKDDYIEWQLKLEELGYKNYWQVLNAKHYGIPQNRERVFMVSILGEYHYTFPNKFPLKLRLKDMLEDSVDEKYYLSNKQMQQLKNTPHEKSSISRVKNINGICNSIDTMGGGNREPKIFCNVNPSGCGINGNVYQGDIAPTLTTNKGEGYKILIPEATKKGYAEAEDGDGVYINRPHQKRGVVQKDMIQTIKTSPDVGVVVKGNYSPSNHNASRIVDEKGIAPTVMENHGTVTAVEVINPLKGKTNNGWHFEQQVYDENGITRTVKAGGGSGNIPKVIENLRIRKLTPKECYRLMGFSDEEFAKAESVISNSQLYKTAGNSIVVDVLYYIFKQLFIGGLNDKYRIIYFKHK